MTKVKNKVMIGLALLCMVSLPTTHAQPTQVTNPDFANKLATLGKSGEFMNLSKVAEMLDLPNLVTESTHHYDPRVSSRFWREYTATTPNALGVQNVVHSLYLSDDSNIGKPDHSKIDGYLEIVFTPCPVSLQDISIAFNAPTPTTYLTIITDIRPRQEAGETIYHATYQNNFGESRILHITSLNRDSRRMKLFANNTTATSGCEISYSAEEVVLR